MNLKIKINKNEISKNHLYSFSVLSSINEIENPIEEKQDYNNEDLFIKLIDDKLIEKNKYINDFAEIIKV